MTTIKKITSSIKANMQSVSQHKVYPNTPGLYAFSLAKGASLKKFGDSGRIIYVGKAEDSLKKRDFDTHFNDKRTGSSTLRRSIGAILKIKLKAIAFSRNGTVVKPNIDNYKFNTKAEQKLSQWMKDNLLIGYWEYNTAAEKETLRDIEEQLIIALKPTLDLDKRTVKYNKHAPALKILRQACKDEATQNVIDKTVYY